MSRQFLKHNNTRQDTNAYEIQVARSMVECSVMCIAKSNECVGFNFNQGPLIMCELSRVPHDAPNAAMVSDTAWDHYAIVPKLQSAIGETMITFTVFLCLIAFVFWFFLHGMGPICHQIDNEWYD